MRSIFVGILLHFSTFCYGQYLSEASTLSLLTGSPGSELYSTFGHSAIRLQDPAQNIDVVFNYGTFDFDTPNFYLKFARGKLLYKLSIESFELFKRGFQYQNRSVVEQELNLSQTQKEQLYQMLLENYKPENRFYKYDFFFDNCATRIRDIFPDTFGDDFRFNYPATWEKEDLTFRNLIDMYLLHHHWSDFGIDLALGLPTDQVAQPADYMFLPDYLMEGFASATINIDGREMALVRATQEIVGRKDIPPDEFFITPAKVCWLIFLVALGLSIFELKNNRRFGWFDILYFSVIGMIGWMVFFLDFFTDHVATKQNLNLLWAIPIHLPVFLFWGKLPLRFRYIYSWIFLVLNGLLLLLWPLIPQQYHVVFIPLMIIMVLRLLLIISWQQDKYEIIRSKNKN